MRRVRYQVAASLDGYIAGPNGEIDWIVSDPGIDFGALYRQFDTALAGRRTYEAMRRLDQTELPGMHLVVFSRTLQPASHPGVTIVGADAERTVSELKRSPGKDIWLFGGSVLFRSLAHARLVDTVEVALMPAILGGGVPLSYPPTIKLLLTNHRVYDSGIVALEYAINS